ncbi:hypothetical protein L3Q82_012091, partial [Scortum barcoo]
MILDYRKYTTERILTGCITAWFGSCTTLNRKALQRVVKTVCDYESISTPSGVGRIIKEPNHASHKLFCLLKFGR